MQLGKEDSHVNLTIEYNGNYAKEYMISQEFVTHAVIAVGFDSLISYIQTREYAITHSIDKEQKFSDEERKTIDDIVATHNFAVELKKSAQPILRYAEVY